ncbi:hypothetical protein [Bradyrhizobium erythrophlei]|uniref:Uncharacterized protein n=1 Tax=Bradyrhizobium erythrophlei TaxID=1437360 RepID=A0A1M5T875_9BRAD|nr:hypothetical protein [Bradyrhizobium erythrophlei]SHH46939.1 hypothetical protein SAMN05444169_7610 [Bradyrhizobium erythrophlei]
MTNTNWTNADGLYVRLGDKEGASAKYGEYKTFGPNRFVELKLDFSDLAAFGTNTVLSNEDTIAKGAHIEKVEIEVETAFVGATATLSLGLIQTDRATLTNLGTTALANAVTVATLTLGSITTLIVGASFVGTLVGSGGNLLNTALITALAGTANFTAGSAKVRVYYTTP